MPIPWYAKIPAKIVLSRLPLNYDDWRRFNIFRAGRMADPGVALQVFDLHRQAAGFDGRTGYRVLEIGPGDSLLSALYARAFGATQTTLVDSHPNAVLDPELYERAQAMLLERGLHGPDVSNARSIDDVQERLNSAYYIDGLQSLKSIPDASIDFQFSNAVLEHVRRKDFNETAREMHRVLAPDGVASHWIDFRDHLQDGLNNLRFSERVWESDFMVNSGFYTNRLTWLEMENSFRKAGFAIEEIEMHRWPNGLPTPQRAMSASFRDMPAENLMVMTNWVLLRKV